VSDLYDETDDDVVRTYRRVHGNGEQTHVAVLSVSDRDYAAVAYDLNPAAFEPVAAEAIGYDPTLEGIHERTERLRAKLRLLNVEDYVNVQVASRRELRSN